MRLVQLAIGVIMLSLLLSIVAGCQPSFPPGSLLVDDLGRQVRIDMVPQRIVSHVPSITEILFALGLGDRVVGVDEYSDYPEAAKAKPKVGGFFNPSVEKIVELEPDLVLTNGSVKPLMPQLDKLGITYIVLQPKTIDGILENIRLVGRFTGTEKKAEKLIADMQERMAYVSNRVKTAARPRVLYLFATTDLNNPWTAGPGSFVDSLITMAGGQNIGAKGSAPWIQFSVEAVVNSDPEVIIINPEMGTALTPKEALKHHPAWQGITAIKRDRIHLIDGNLIERSGPRIVQGLEEVAKILHPELFQ